MGFCYVYTARAHVMILLLGKSTILLLSKISINIVQRILNIFGLFYFSTIRLVYILKTICKSTDFTGSLFFGTVALIVTNFKAERKNETKWWGKKANDLIPVLNMTEWGCSKLEFLTNDELKSVHLLHWRE